MSFNSSSLGPSGTSRVEGATIGTPPLLEMRCAISLARRLSNESTRSPLNPAISDEHSREADTAWHCLTSNLCFYHALIPWYNALRSSSSQATVYGALRAANDALAGL